MTNIQDLRPRTPFSNNRRSISRVTHIARHHSATEEGNFDAFMNFWRSVRGWGTGGYHEIILRDGTVQRCYNYDQITNGVANHNPNIYNICLVGNGSFTEAQEKAFEERAENAMKVFNLTASRVLGHNEFSGTNTTCPGINMNIVRSRLTAGNGPVQTATPPKGMSAPIVTVSNSIVDWMSKNKLDSSFANREKLAAQYGIGNYRGTAEQNTSLLKLLQSGAKSTTGKSIAQMAQEVIDKKHGNGHDNRRKSLGINTAEYEKVRAEVNLRSRNATPAPTVLSRPKPRAGEGIVDYMSRTKMDSSFSNRAKLAAQHGITEYRGTAIQNSRLLTLISS